MGLLPPRLKALLLCELQPPTAAERPAPVPAVPLLRPHPPTSHSFVDVLPPSLVELDLGDCYDHPMLTRCAALIPAHAEAWAGGSVSRCRWGRCRRGCSSFGFRPSPDDSNFPLLQPGVLPSTLLAIDFSDRYGESIPAGVIPSSVRWMRLPAWCADGDIEVVLPARVVVVWYCGDASSDVGSDDESTI